MQLIPIREINPKYRWWPYFVPLFTTAICGLLASVATWDEVKTGIVPSEVWLVTKMGAFAGLVAVPIFVWVGKNLYYDPSKSVLFYTRPYLPWFHQKTYLIGRPVRIKVSTVRTGKSTVHQVDFECAGTFAKKQFSYPCGTPEDAVKLAKQIAELSGAQLILPQESEIGSPNNQ